MWVRSGVNMKNENSFIWGFCYCHYNAVAQQRKNFKKMKEFNQKRDIFLKEKNNTYFEYLFCVFINRGKCYFWENGLCLE
jgi:hypothetical protein